MGEQILLGNQAIALGLVEQGCRVVTAYPGTPSSEILAGVVKYKEQLGRQVYAEWSTNEKVALEIALAASWTGLATTPVDDQACRSQEAPNTSSESRTPT